MDVSEAKTEVADGPSDWGPRGTAAATFAARLAFEHVSHRYGSLEAVRDVSLEMTPGEIVCLLGPSGCGKTTLLRIAAGVERPQSGRVLLDAKEVAGPEAFVPPEHRNVGLMFQDFALFPHLTILDNVAFGLRGLDRSKAVEQARAALRRVGMSQYETAYPHSLSGGEQQRVALARAIVPRPAVMLMDEPFSGLDQRLRESVREETLAVLRETRASCLLVTHDPVEAMWMADRIAVMRAGQLIQSGAPTEVYRIPADLETAKFFCDYNEVHVQARDGKASTPFGDFKTPAELSNDAVTVLIRPQAFVPVSAKTGIEAVVLDVRFLGDVSLLTLGFEGCELPVTARVSGSVLPENGVNMRFKLDPEHVLMFPRKTEGSTADSGGYQ